MKESEFHALLALQQKELVVLKRKDHATKQPFWRAYVAYKDEYPSGGFPTYMVWEESTRSKAIRALIKKWYRHDRNRIYSVAKT